MKKVICLLLAIMVIMLSSCIKEKELNTSVRNYSVYNMKSLPKDLLMLDSSSIREEDFALLLFDGLVSTNSDGEIIPAISDSWEVSEDKLTYSFHIREAQWNDGSDITAKDFVDFFSRILKEENNIYASSLQCIFGVKDYIDKKIDFSGVAIIPKEDRILEIRLNYPCNYFLEIISQPVFGLKKNFYNLRNWKTEYKKISYTGAFIIEDIYGNGEISLKRNNRYWNEKEVLSSKIHITNVEDEAYALAKYKSGEIDAFVGMPTSEISELSEDEKIKRYSMAEGVSLNFNLNKNGIIKNSNFRKLISTAVNRDVIEGGLKGILSKSYYYVPRNINGASLGDEFTALSIQYEEIKSQLNSIYNGEPLRLVYYNMEDANIKIADSIISDLERINLNIKAKGYDKEELKRIVDNKEYEILLENYIGEYDYPLSFLDQWSSNSKENIYGYKNVEFDNMLLKGKVMGDKRQSEESLMSAEKILLKDYAFIPIGIYNVLVCKKPYISGIEVNKRGNVILKGIHTSKENITP